MSSCTTVFSWDFTSIKMIRKQTLPFAFKRRWRRQWWMKKINAPSHNKLPPHRLLLVCYSVCTCLFAIILYDTPCHLSLLRLYVPLYQIDLSNPSANNRKPWPLSDEAPVYDCACSTQHVRVCVVASACDPPPVIITHRQQLIPPLPHHTKPVHCFLFHFPFISLEFTERPPDRPTNRPTLFTTFPSLKALIDFFFWLNI